MIEQAKTKLQAEMDGAKDNAYVQFIGQFILKHVEAHPEDAEKILTEGKTIAKSLDAMRTAASKKKVGNVAMLTPIEGFTVVLEFFGIKKQLNMADFIPATVTAASAPTPTPQPASDFDVSLDAYL